FEMWPNVSRLPKAVVSGMGQKLIPLRGAAFQKERIRIGQRPHAEEEVIAIGRFEVEVLQLLVQRIFGLLREPVKESEVLRQKKRAIVVDVITHEPVGDGRLRRGGL